MTPARELDPEEFKVANSHLNFPVVGFGASAGGLGALQKLLQKMPASPGMSAKQIARLVDDAGEK